MSGGLGGLEVSQTFQPADSEMMAKTALGAHRALFTLERYLILIFVRGLSVVERIRLI
jgi:hypothetical protein